MSQPLVATGRLKVQITVNSLIHTLHAYVRNIQTAGSSFNINSRATDSNDLDWKDAAEGWFESLTYAAPAGITASDITLEQLVSLVWTPLATFTPTVSNESGTALPAGQITLVLRDKLFKKVKVLFLEGNQGAPQHWNSPTGGNAAMQNFTKQWLSTFTVTHAPYNWQVGRSNQFLAASPFVGYTVALNRKLRRRRGLA